MTVPHLLVGWHKLRVDGLVETHPQGPFHVQLSMRPRDWVIVGIGGDYAGFVYYFSSEFEIRRIHGKCENSGQNAE